MEQSEKDNEINELLEKAIEHMLNEEEAQAEIIVNSILERDPESLDAHLLKSKLLPFRDETRLDHIRFILDRNISYQIPHQLTYKRFDHVEDFLLHLQIKSHEVQDKNEEEYQKILNEYIGYASRLLAANVTIPELDDFARILMDCYRFEEVINIGYFLSGDKKAKDIGWPGLEFSKGHNDLDIMDTVIMDAFFESKKYEEGCTWIHKCLLLKNTSHFRWYLLGEALAWLGYPEETVRAWIIAVEKGSFTIREHDTFEKLSNMVCDSDYEEKDKLHSLLYYAKSKLPPEKMGVLEELNSLVYSSMNNDDKPVPSIKFMEDKLGIKLEEPPLHRNYLHDRLHLGKRSSSPIVQEVISTIDKHIGNDSGAREIKIPQTVSQKVKVAVGEGPSLEQSVKLNQFGINVTELARKGEVPPVIGRDREIDRMVRILARSEKNNPVLLGEAGVGKTAVVYGLAQRIAKNNVPEVLKNKIIVELNVGALVAGTTYRGDFEQRMTDIIKEMRNNPEIILFIDEFHTLIGAGDSKGQMDASNILKPALTSGEIRLIGATTSREYSKYIEPDAAFERRFSPIYLNEVSQQVTFSVIKVRVPFWEKHHNVKIPESILKLAIHLTDQHIKHRHFPDKAIDLMDEACALARIVSIKDKNATVTLEHNHLKKIIDQWLGATTIKGLIPENFLEKIEQMFTEHIIGHKNLIKELCHFIVDEKLGLNISRLPRVLYFYGFPDSGKTECAKTISKVLWPDEQDRFLYLDMSLYNDPSDLNRLIGAPGGTIGSEDGGRLSSYISRNPFSVVYLHNFHKAHERLIRFFAGLFREGLFSDGTAKTIYAANTIFILSSTIYGNGKRIGFMNGHDKVTENLLPVHKSIPDLVRALDIPSDILHFVKYFYFFNKINDEELGKLIKKKIEIIANQPSIRERKIIFDDKLVNEIIDEYNGQPQERLNLRGLLQKKVYQTIDL